MTPRLGPLAIFPNFLKSSHLQTGVARIIGELKRQNAKQSVRMETNNRQEAPKKRTRVCCSTSQWRFKGRGPMTDWIFNER
jgi:hypothetical protein